MTDIAKLEAAYEKAERKAADIQNTRDRALQKVRDTYDERLVKANKAAAEAQKELNDANAAQALVGREDAETVARMLGLELPNG